MAISTSLTNESGIPIKYWRVNKLLSLDIDKKEAVISAAGYFSEEAKANGLNPITNTEFLIINQQEKIEKTRPATLEEKRELIKNDPVKPSDEKLEQIPYDILEGVEIIEYNYFDDFIAALNKQKDWRIAAYNCLAVYPASKAYFTDYAKC